MTTMTHEAHLQLYAAARPRLLSLAYRMTGSYSDSEDILQDAYLKFARVPAEKVESAGALLTTIVTRLALDLLKSARKKRETYVGPWLPEPMPDLYLSHEDPAERESVSMAFLLLLQNLPPIERAVFILREIFDYDYAEIAKIVRKTADYCRQIFHRAKKNVRREHTTAPTPGEKERALLAAFLSACAGNELERLVHLLQADAQLISDGGGKASASSIPVIGRTKIAKFIFAVRDKGGAKEYYVARLNNGLAIVAYANGLPYAVQIVGFAGDEIATSYAMRNPDKMRLFLDRDRLVKEGVLVPAMRYFSLGQQISLAWSRLGRWFKEKLAYQQSRQT